MAQPHVRIVRDALEIDGRPTFLVGGEVQYFRVRDAQFEPGRTWKIWAERLDQLRAAGLDFLATYVPWDYHERREGVFDFTGCRDVARFLEMAAERGFRLCVKPGPNILGEWPYGFTSWGAIPTWWKRKHRGELIRDWTGRIFRWHPFFPSIAPGRNTLPSLASETFRASTEAWYRAFHERVKHLIGPGKPIVAIQLDNEVNNFWTDAYRIDFHPAALARFRERLRARYGTPGALSRAYGHRYGSFEEVRPPRKGQGPPAAHRDWFEHQHALCAEWIGACRAIWARLGVNEPDVLFLTNDTHHSFPGRDLVLPNGPLKNLHGLHALDTYPRAFPIPRRARVLYDRPYEADVTNKLIDVYNDLYLGPSRFTMGIEVQGGHFAFSFHGYTFQPHRVSPESTTQTYLRLIAHGMKALGIYTVCGGLNLDNSSYAFQAALRLDGTTHPRFEGLRSVARFVRRHERDLLASVAVESRAGILASARALGPGHGFADDQRIYGDELRACFGWLANAGFTPRLLDVDLASEQDLAACKLLLFPTSGNFDEAAAAKLERYVARGGTLVQALRPGPLAGSLFPAAEIRRPARFFSFASGAASFRVGGGGGSVEVPLRGVSRWRLPPGAEPVLYVPGEEPLNLGYSRRAAGGGRAIFLGALPTAEFASARYFTERPPALAACCLFARRLLAVAGERPLFTFGHVREECHARRVPATGDVFLFLLSSHEAGSFTVRLSHLDALGLDPQARYAVEDVFSEKEPVALGERTGAALRDLGVALSLPLGASTVLRVRRV